MLLGLVCGCVLRVLLARSVIYHPFGVEQIDFQPDQEERLLNACQTIVAIASVMQSFKMLQLAYVDARLGPLMSAIDEMVRATFAALIISPVSPLHLPCISHVSPLYLPPRQRARGGLPS